MSDDFKKLLSLRDAINASIDAYVALTPEQKLQKPVVDRARQQICSTANQLAAETVNPMQEATLLSFMVRHMTQLANDFSTELLLALAKCSCEDCTRLGHF